MTAMIIAIAIADRHRHDRHDRHDAICHQVAGVAPMRCASAS
jgi:hypothetical protein